MKKVKGFLIELYRILRLPEMLILPGNLAFFMFLSLIPIISVAAFIATKLSLSPDSLLSFIGNTLPVQILDIIRPFVENPTIITKNIILCFSVFYISSNGPDSLIIASNTLYGVKNKSYVHRRLKALVMTLLFIVLIIAILLILAFSNIILDMLMNIKIIGTIISNNYIVITIFKYILSFAIVLAILKLIYMITPDKKIKSSEVNKGALFSTISIILLSSLYSFYINNFTNYDVVYGSLASLTILLFFLYLVSFIIVIGIAINHN